MTALATALEIQLLRRDPSAKVLFATLQKFRFLAHSRASPCRSAAASGVISLKDPDAILFRSNPKTQSEALRRVLTAFTRSCFNGTGKMRLERHTARFYVTSQKLAWGDLRSHRMPAKFHNR